MDWSGLPPGYVLDTELGIARVVWGARGRVRFDGKLTASHDLFTQTRVFGQTRMRQAFSASIAEIIKTIKIHQINNKLACN